MPFKLTESILEELWLKAEQQKQAFWVNTEVDEIDRATFPHIGRLWKCFTSLQEGLSVRIEEWEVAKSLWFSGYESENNTEICLSFNLAGKVETHHHDLTEEVSEFVGYYQFEHLSRSETEIWTAGEPFRRIYLNFDPVLLFKNLNDRDSDRFPIEIRHFLEGNYYPFYRSQIITPQIHQILQQILNCPYTGILKRMYFQGKAWELLTLTFDQFLSQVNISSQQLLKPSEVEKIHQAKEILLSHLNNPPSLNSLARQANLNEFSLKQGFKQIFGTTVFRYLHEHRLEMARQLLANNDMKIEVIAQKVGFANRSYFARSFRQKFGLNPKEYRQQRAANVHIA
jgi:AraC family transcriptional regulator, transcriptional activator of the genes for pyochelin and ferripyochelin receptors